jgi:hypothetical protein
LPKGDPGSHTPDSLVHKILNFQWGPIMSM